MKELTSSLYAALLRMDLKAFPVPCYYLITISTLGNYSFWGFAAFLGLGLLKFIISIVLKLWNNKLNVISKKKKGMKQLAAALSRLWSNHMELKSSEWVFKCG